MPLPEFSGILGYRNAAHLLRRATFGATKSQVETFASLTPGQAIQQLFRQPLTDPAPPIDPAIGSEWVSTGPTAANSEGFDLERYFLCWHLGQMMSAGVPDAQLLSYCAREKLVFFLHTHFTTIKSKVSSSRALYYQNVLFRRFALDAMLDERYNIKELTVKLSVDNAMLRLLDGNLNVKGRVNENYARELLELYTIGRGLEGKVPEGLPAGDYFVFTEHDVVTAAKVLSGWDLDNEFSNIDADTGLPRGKVRGTPNNASSHDNTVKIFSERFSHAQITPDSSLTNGGEATEESALDEIRQLIDMIYSKADTARNICWKIYRFFVYAPHDKYAPGNRIATIDEEIIPEMAQVLIDNGFKIQPVIENLLRSQHFYDSATSDSSDDNYGSMIKSPLDLVVGTLRSFGATVPAMQSDTMEFYARTGEILSSIEYLGMNFYEPFDVAGYEAYHQFPIYNRIWITPNSLARRYDFIRSLFSQSESMFSINSYDYVRQNFMSVAANANELIIALARTLLPVTENLSFNDEDTDGGLTARRLNYFKERFLQEFDESYWTTRWNLGLRDLKDQLDLLFNAMLQSPEYQLS